MPLRFWNSSTDAPATSSAMKCGTSHITGRSLRSASLTSPSTWIRRRRRSGGANQSSPRSSRLRPSQRKCSRDERAARLDRLLGKAQLDVAQRDATARAGQGVQQAPERAAERRLHAERQALQEPHEAEQKARAHFGICPSARGAHSTASAAGAVDGAARTRDCATRGRSPLFRGGQNRTGKAPYSAPERTLPGAVDIYNSGIAEL